MSNFSKAIKQAGHSVTPASTPSAPTSRHSEPSLDGFWPEVLSLYYNVDALRMPEKSVVLQFMSSRPGEGTTTIARQFAAIAVQEKSHPVLVIDCSPGSGPLDILPGEQAPSMSLATVWQEGRALTDAIMVSKALPSLHYARLSDRPNSILHTNTSALAEVFRQAREEYRFTILDTPAASQSPDSLVLTRHADGLILVVEAEKTRSPVVRRTIADINRFEGKLLGCVFNKRRFYISKWIYSRL